MKMITNLQDLADHLGAWEATPASIGRRLYKDTDCGAWITFYFPGAPAETVECFAEVRPDPAAGGRLHLHKLIPADPAVALLLGFENGGKAPEKTDGAPDCWDSLEAFTKAARELQADPGSNAGEIITEIAPCVGCVRLRVKRDTPARLISLPCADEPPAGLDLASCVAVQVGSIVEGSDAEFSGDLMFFPFTPEEFDRQVENINDEACAAWDEANGAESEDAEAAEGKS
jgi:hypothetical protein